MKGALDAIGIDSSRLDIVLIQLVRLVRGGEVVRMSKRTGKAITLTNLLDEISIDAARFFFVMTQSNSQMDFDLDLAVEQSSQNPVYYVQYAHARICSILKRMEQDGVTVRPCTRDELLLLRADEEKEIIRHLASLTGEIVSAAKSYDPSKITRYSLDLATLFHKFYNSCRIMGEEEGLMQARLHLCLAVKNTIKNVLKMIGISAPESM
jgi:arginyl-tRNA synthetase